MGSQVTLACSQACTLDCIDIWQNARRLGRYYRLAMHDAHLLSGALHSQHFVKGIKGMLCKVLCGPTAACMYAAAGMPSAQLRQQPGAQPVNIARPAFWGHCEPPAS